MKNLMRKELVLAMHPASVLFLLLSAMLPVQNISSDWHEIHAL